MAGQKGIPQTIVDEIRARVDIVAVVGDHVLLKKAGANFSGLCPFHNEKSPSFTVHPGKRIFHCFGCGAGGDVFTFLMRIQNLSFPAVLEKLATQVGIDWTPFRNRGSDVDLGRAHEILREAQRHFRKALAAARPAKSYLEERGLTAKTLQEFAIGWAPDEWRTLSDALQAAGYGAEELVQWGLIRRGKESGFYDYFRGRVIFPIEDEYGKPVGFGGRVLGDGQPKYLNSPESLLYNKGRLLFNLHRAAPAAAEAGVLLLVEGYMDAIGLYQHGFTNVVATLGTALTEAQVRKIAKVTKCLVLAYDPDPAGVKATLRALPLLESAALDVKMLRLPDGIDPDEFVKTEGADALRKRLADGQPVEAFLFEVTRDRHPQWRAADGKRAALRDMAEVFRLLPSPLSQQNFIERVADAFEIGEELVRKSFTGGAAASAVDSSPESEQARAVSPLVQAERTLIYCFLSEFDTYREGGAAWPVSEWRDPFCKRILQLLSGMEAGSGEIGSRLVTECEDEDLRRFLTAEMAVRPPADSETAHRMLADCLREVRRHRLESRKRELQRLVANTPGSDESLREFQKITEELQTLLKSPEEGLEPASTGR